jgi:hypothetical protein
VDDRHVGAQERLVQGVGVLGEARIREQALGVARLVLVDGEVPEDPERVERQVALFAEDDLELRLRELLAIFLGLEAVTTGGRLDRWVRRPPPRLRDEAAFAPRTPPEPGATAMVWVEIQAG